MDVMTSVELQTMQMLTQQSTKSTQEAPEGDSFREMLKKRSGTETKETESTETSAEAKKTDEAASTKEPTPVPVEEEPAMREQLLLAAMNAMQKPVLYTEPTPEVQPEAAAAVDAVVQAAEIQTAAPQVETAVIPEETARIQAEAQPQDALTVEQSADGPETVEVKAPEHREVALERPEALQDTPEDVKVVEAVEAEPAEEPVFGNVEHVPVKVGEAPMTEEAETAVPVKTQISQKLAEPLRNGESRVQIQLEPENLGKVEVELTWREDGSLYVELKAENSATRTLLEKDAAGLQALLMHDDGREVHVEVQRQQESQQQQQDLPDGQREGRQQQHQQEQERPEHPEDFLQQLRLGMIPQDAE